MNKKLLSGLMSVVMLAGSCPTLGAYYTPVQAWGATKSFVKQHKKVVGGSVAGAVLLLGAFYFRNEIKSGVISAAGEVGDLFKKKLASKPTSGSSSNLKSVKCATKISENVEKTSPIETEIKEEESKSEPESVEDATGSTTVPTTETESVKSATESETSSELAEKAEDTTKSSEYVKQASRSEILKEMEISDKCGEIVYKINQIDYKACKLLEIRPSLGEEKKLKENKEFLMEAKSKIDKLYAELHSLVVETGKIPSEVIDKMEEYEKGILSESKLIGLADELFDDLKDRDYSIHNAVSSLICKIELEKRLSEMK